MKREIIQTLDGSTTIHIADWEECYHSKHGAIQEAQHVFIKNGLSLFQNQKITILEIGFGTGLNAFITLLEAKKMQQDMEKSQEELASKEFDATAGGGAISVKVSGNKEIKEIIIKKDVVDPEDVEMLQDLIITCVNEALRKVDSAQAAQLGKYNIPGLM